jgi:hypothetical protein
VACASEHSNKHNSRRNSFLCSCLYHRLFIVVAAVVVVEKPIGRCKSNKRDAGKLVVVVVVQE